MNLEKHLEAIDNLTAALGKVRENSKKDKELSRVLAQAAKLEHENAKLKRALRDREEELADVRERAEHYQKERDQSRAALGNISNYLSEFWLSDPNEDWDNLANHLYRAGFNCVRDWNGEPEPFIHGDNAEGPAGGRARCETEGFAEGAEG